MQNSGPCFGKNFDIGNDNFSNNFISNFPSSYMDTLGKGRSIFTGDLNNNNKSFKVQKIEIYKIINN